MLFYSVLLPLCSVAECYIIRSAIYCCSRLHYYF